MAIDRRPQSIRGEPKHKRLVTSISSSANKKPMGFESRRVEVKTNYYSYLNQNEKKALSQKLEKFFIFYASFGDRLNISKLKLKNFLLMMSDAKILDEDEMP
jgi:hypothetical protein